MAERTLGAFGDYTGSPQGIYDPWAVGINAAMGGAQFGADRRAQEQERSFAEQQRGRSRAQWAREDELMKGASEITERYKSLLETQDDVGGPATGQVVENKVAMSFDGAAPVTATSALPVQQARLRRDNPITVLRLQAMQSAEMADNATKAGFYDQAEKYTTQQRTLYDQYARSAANAFEGALDSRDPRAMDRLKTQYRDIFAAFDLDIKRSAKDVKDPVSGAPMPGYELVGPDGKPAVGDDGKPIPVMNRVDLAKQIGSMLGQPAVQETLLARAFEIHDKERDAWTRRRAVDVQESALQQQILDLRSRGLEQQAAWLESRRKLYQDGVMESEKLDFKKVLGVTVDESGNIIGGDASFKLVTPKGEVPIANVKGLDWGWIEGNARNLYASAFVDGMPITSNEAARAAALPEMARATGQSSASDGTNTYTYGLVTLSNGQKIPGIHIASIARDKAGKPLKTKTLFADPREYYQAVVGSPQGAAPTGQFEPQAMPMPEPAAAPAPSPKTQPTPTSAAGAMRNPVAAARAIALGL